MHQQAGPEARAPREQPRREVERDAVQMALQQRAQADIGVGHDRQRRQEVLAELAIAHPRKARLVALERQGVDERGATLVQLKVACAGVLERQAVVQRPPLHMQGCQGGSLELRERPLEGIGNELELRGPDDGCGIGRGGEAQLDGLVRDEEAVLDETGVKPRVHQGGKGCLVGPVDLAEERAIALEDEARRVAERTRQARVRVGDHPSSRLASSAEGFSAGVDRRTNPMIRPNTYRNQSRAESSPPRTAAMMI